MADSERPTFVEAEWGRAPLRCAKDEGGAYIVGLALQKALARVGAVPLLYRPLPSGGSDPGRVTPSCTFALYAIDWSDVNYDIKCMSVCEFRVCSLNR